MERTKPNNFIEEFVEEDLRTRGNFEVVTRFPPEPNGYLHIGHAKALWVDFSIAQKYGGRCNLRFDDTNPAKEDVEYVEAIKQDIRWLGYQWDELRFGSDYFEQCYDFALQLIRDGYAYVCDLNRDEIREYRGTLTEPGRNSPYRDRSVEESIGLFRRMRAGEFPDGARTLRAKIDMASPNMNMRDPALYRILHKRHHQTGDAWCIYPMYDFAHPIQDALEGVTHSLCSLEYEDHRPLYDWVIAVCGFAHKPRQIEFARLNLTDTVMSKRHLRTLVETGLVSGWDDPRMPTLCGMRRRGYPPEAILDFLARAGVAKADSVVDLRMLESCVREQLNTSAPRVMAVLDPVRLVIDNWEEGREEPVDLENMPGQPHAGTRTLYFGKECWIEREDFMEDPPRKYFRLKPGGEVRLKGAYIVKYAGVEKDAAGNIVCVHAEYDPDSRSGQSERKVKGTLHWLNARHAVPAAFRLYEPLFAGETDDSLDFEQRLNRNSLRTLAGFVESALAGSAPGKLFQFVRQGYFCRDASQELLFHRTVSLKDSFKL